MFSGFQDKWVTTFDLFQGQPLEVANIVAWSQVEVFSTWLSVDPPLDIIPMLTKASLEALSGFANIFGLRMV